jgi:tRNA A37 methylthiotransferase MiaB
MAPQVPAGEKRRRKAVMLRLAEEMALRYKSQFLSKTVEVLILDTKTRKESTMEGVTDRYMFTLFERNKGGAGGFATVEVTGATPKYLLGKEC